MKVLEKAVSEIRSMFPNTKRDFGKKDWSLTLVQNVSNAAGPDTMLLQIDASGRKLRGHLDIYQQKFRDLMFQKAKLTNAAISLGRNVGYGNQSDEAEKANKTEQCLQNFVALLTKEFGFKITIRKRVLVIKQRASEFNLLPSWKNVLGDGVKDGVMVWTFEFLQPTWLFPEVFPQLLPSTQKDDGDNKEGVNGG